MIEVVKAKAVEMGFKSLGEWMAFAIALFEQKPVEEVEEWEIERWIAVLGDGK